MLLAKTHKHQSSLATYCRNGEPITIEGAIQKNLKHYRRLVINNVLDSLSTAYPITEKLLGENEWEALVNRFFSSYKIQSPQIWYMPKEFKDYVLTYEKTLLEQFFVLETLLEFEWLEVDVFMMPDIPFEKPKEANRYALNPETKLLKLDFPVHLKSASLITKEEKNTYFVSLHRNPENGSVQFTNLSIPLVDVLEHLSLQPLSTSQIKAILKKYAPTNVANQVLEVFLQQAIATQLIFN